MLSHQTDQEVFEALNMLPTPVLQVLEQAGSSLILRMNMMRTLQVHQSTTASWLVAIHMTRWPLWRLLQIRRTGHSLRYQPRTTQRYEP
jgi:hypothetical protein